MKNTKSAEDIGFVLKSDWLLDALYASNTSPAVAGNIELESIFYESPIINFILNFPAKGYVHVSENVHSILGTTPEFLIQGGISHGITLFAKEHRPIFIDHVLPLMLGTFKTLADTGKDTLRTKATYNIHMLDKNGKSFPTMHILKPITKDEHGLPVLAMKYIIDISQIKPSTQPDIKFEYLNEKEEYEIIASKTFYENRDGSLSNREHEVMDLVSKGFSSKEIAEKLCLSIHTVNNHRKKIASKYKVKSLHQIANPILQKD